MSPRPQPRSPPATCGFLRRRVVSPISPSRGVAGRLIRALAGGFRLCRLLRADGSRFAQAEIDPLRRVLALRFFRRSGTLLFASDAQFPAKTTAEGADVGCNNDNYNTIGPREWQQPHTWWVGKTPGCSRCRQGRPGAPLGLFGVDEQHQLVRSRRQCESPVGLPGPDGAQDQARRNECRRLGQPGGRPGLQRALACAATWYDERGQSGRVGHPFQHRSRSGRSARTPTATTSSRSPLTSLDTLGSSTTSPAGTTPWSCGRTSRKGDTSLRKLGRGDSRGNNTNY